jgi:ribonuclease HI
MREEMVEKNRAKPPQQPDLFRPPEAGPSWTLYVDGGARGNPGPSGAGAVLYDGKGRRVAAMKWALGRGTNNEAEYEGLIRGLDMSSAAGARTLEGRSDSELMVKQMNGEYRVKAPHLRKAVERARAAAAVFTAVRFTAIPRERNGEADRLANNAMDEADKKAGRSRQEA